MTPAELVARHKHILLDFDGPVCAVFGGELSDRAAADELKKLVGPDMPDDVAAAHDPFDVLRYANKIDTATAQTVESRFRELELDAVTTAPETAGAKAAIKSLVAAGHVIAIVSNNSAAAVRRYVDIHGLSGLIDYVNAREAADVELLKPAPFLLRQAMETLCAPSATCVMIGDSEADVDAARAAGTSVVGYANKPGKRERLQRRGADAVTDQLSELALAWPAPQ
ncbi:HAD family hydrolase [Prauserella shujinwangii]|uniref:HAD family hydrolase n=1 Tax=Prauserella shujinwangii TaxID=1453103 RepID=UPI000D083144|nr:HAD-IA family hydrolase [Prauserella shujinwangii]